MLGEALRVDFSYRAGIGEWSDSHMEYSRHITLFYESDTGQAQDKYMVNTRYISGDGLAQVKYMRLYAVTQGKHKKSI